MARARSSRSCSTIDDGYLFQARQTVGNRGAGAVAVQPYASSAGSARRATSTAGPSMSARWACSTARPITAMIMTTSPKPASAASPAAAAGSASPTSSGWPRSSPARRARSRRRSSTTGASNAFQSAVRRRADHRPDRTGRDLHLAPVRRRQGDPAARPLQRGARHAARAGDRLGLVPLVHAGRSSRC